MNSATALTIIAISMALLAVIAVVAIVFLMRLVRHLMAFERTLVSELAELRELMSQFRETTERVSHTVRDVQVAARRVGGVVGAVASIFFARSINNKSSTRDKLRPWWLTGASVGWTFIKKRRQNRKKRSKIAALDHDSPLPR